MNPKHVMGLGEPKPVGKKILFQPGEDAEGDFQNQHGNEISSVQLKPRVRTTISLTNKALATIQEIQNHYRLHTGKVLPLWKIVSDAIEYYGQSKGDKRKNEKTFEANNDSNSGPNVSTTSRASLTQT
ncbi:MAG: hypothetical protein JW908_09220 [Anaerolineales bacterium]|nr:hypothetical protein [Anaerolineales bacterium]